MLNEPCLCASKHQVQLCKKILRSNEHKDIESCLNICTASMFACSACCMCIEVCTIRCMSLHVCPAMTLNNIFSCQVLFLSCVWVNKSLTLSVSDCSRVAPC